MSTALGVGTTSFRAVSVDEGIARDGLDSLTVTLRGKATGLAVESALWTRGRTYPGYTSMYLQSKSTADRGPVAEIVLNFIGFIESSSLEGGLVDLDDGISLSSVRLNTDEDEDVTFSYYAQSSTWKWISRGPSKPEQPKFRAVVPSAINTSNLFSPYPPNYNGSIAGRSKNEGRLAQFQRTRLAPSVWSVVETWETLIVPDL